jgi:Dcp1-like decapping family
MTRASAPTQNATFATDLQAATTTRIKYSTTTMTPKKAKGRQRNPINAPEAVGAASDYAQYAQTTTRNNNDLNLSVLSWYLPTIAAIIAVSPYVALYQFSPNTQTWEKADIEGPMFICALQPTEYGEESFAVVIMNRRALENFVAAVISPDEIEFQDGFIILKEEMHNKHGELGMKVYGLWVHSADMQSGDLEPAAEADPNQPDMKETNYHIMLECAKRAEASRKTASKARLDAEHQARHSGRQLVQQAEEELAAAVPMGRQLSLRELFGKQREEDSGFSIHDHHSDRPSPFIPQSQSAQAPPVPQHRQQPSPSHPLPHHEYQPQILAPTAIHTYSTTSAVHTSASQFTAATNQQPLQHQIQPQAQDLISLFQSPPQAQPQSQQTAQAALPQPPSHSQSSTPYFQSNPDTDFFRAPPRHTPQQQQQNNAASHPPVSVQQNGAGSIAAFGNGGIAIEELFKRARQGQ